MLCYREPFVVDADASTGVELPSIALMEAILATAIAASSGSSFRDKANPGECCAGRVVCIMVLARVCINSSSSSSSSSTFA